MAIANTLTIGDTYKVRSGQFAGQTVRILNNRPVPDGQVNQRLIEVAVLEDGQDECPVFILPRLIEDAAPRVPQFSTALDTRITDPMDPRLDAWRPDPKVAKNYVSRIVPGGLKDVDFLLKLWRAKDENGYSPNILLAGDTQAGKTMLVEVLACLVAKELGYDKPLPVFLLSGGSGVTDFELFGKTMPYTGDDGIERLVHLPGVVALAASVDHSIFYIDESNALSEKVTSALHPVLDDRRYFINTNKAVKVPGDGFSPDVARVSKGCWTLGTYNPGYRGMGLHNEAFINRFRVLPWGYDEDVEKQLIPSETVRILGLALREARSARTIQTPVGTKALQRLCEDLAAFPVATALWAFKGIFQPAEQPRVEAIITDRSIVDLLEAEFTPQEDKTEAVVDPIDAEKQELLDQAIALGLITKKPAA